MEGESFRMKWRRWREGGKMGEGNGAREASELRR